MRYLLPLGLKGARRDMFVCLCLFVFVCLLSCLFVGLLFCLFVCCLLRCECLMCCMLFESCLCVCLWLLLCVYSVLCCLGAKRDMTQDVARRAIYGRVPLSRACKLNSQPPCSCHTYQMELGYDNLCDNSMADVSPPPQRYPKTKHCLARGHWYDGRQT